MEKTVIKISGSLYVAITAAAKELKIKEGEEVEVLRKGKTIVIKKIEKEDK